MDNSNQYKVRLESYSHGTSSVATSQVVFDVMPSITETISVDYQALDPIHMPGSFFVYKGTKSSTYELGELRLISRTPNEASTNQAIRNTLRGWTKPYFGFGTANGSGAPVRKTQYEWQRTDASGKTVPLTAQDVAGVLSAPGPFQSTNFNPNALNEKQKQLMLQSSNKALAQKALDDLNAQKPSSQTVSPVLNGASYKRVAVSEAMVAQSGKQFLGAPPEVLYLTAYSNPSITDGMLDRSTNIYRVPVVITNLSITYPNDVDYIPTLDGEPFPIIMSLSVSLSETHSPQEFENFDIFKYRDGKLPGF